MSSDDSTREPQSAPAGDEAARIVVGVDGSDSSLAALHWAVGEAEAHGATLHVLMAYQDPMVYNAPNIMALGMSFDVDAELGKATEAEVTRLAQEATAGRDVRVNARAVRGHPARALLDESEGAAMVVIGTRGHGGFVGALLGSVSQHVVAHSRCPVVVIPDPDED